jgi:putative SbcD/Mre11-related phosphoesterase
VEEINLGDFTLTRYSMLYLEEEETAVLADLHLGFEDVMAQKGLFLPKLQFPRIITLLEKIVDKYAPKRIIIDGDLKHEFSRNMPQEWDEIEKFVDYLSSNSELILIRGNHDNFLKTILERRGLKLHNHYSLGKFLFAHGHRDVEIPEGKILVMGHEHPSVTIRDETSASTKLPTFLISERIIVLPAVSIYAIGTDITKNDFMSPVLKKYPQDFEIYAIDEIFGVIRIGKLSELLSEKFM